jgi:ribosomal protein S27AE
MSEGLRVILKSCPKCGGLMEKRGSGKDHNLRIKNRNVLRVKHETRHITYVARPLMYACQKCGYIEFYAPTAPDESTKIGKESIKKTRSTRQDDQYFT